MKTFSRIPVVLLLAALLATLTAAAPAGALVNHDAVVEDTPRSGNDAVPQVLDGKVRAHAMFGSMVIVGGEFSSVKDIDGTVHAVSNLYAYDFNTGQMNTAFTPAVNNQVRQAEVSPDGNSLYVAGKFTTVDGLNIQRVARFDSNLTLDTSFAPAINGPVFSLAISPDRIYVGGSFGWVGGIQRSSLAALFPATGSVDPAFSMDVTGVVHRYQNGVPTLEIGYGVYALEITPDFNYLMTAHEADQVDGVDRPGASKIDISNLAGATLTGWAANPYFTENCFNVAQLNGWEYTVRDADISPDGTYFVIGSSGNDRAPLCDTVQRYEVAPNTPIDPTWVARMYSSVFSVAVSDTAVYAAGHFCAAPRFGVDPAIGGVTSTNHDRFLAGCSTDPNANLWEAAPYINDPLAIARDDLAALDPVTAQALDWNPGTNNFTGGFDVTVTDEGLFYGGDSDRVNDIKVGRSAFFAVPSPDVEVDTTPPSIAMTTGITQNPGIINLNGTITDAQSGPDRAEIAITKVATGEYWNGTGFQNGWTRVPATLNGNDTWTLPNVDLTAPGNYLVQMWSWDNEGNKASWRANPQPVIDVDAVVVIDTTPPTIDMTTGNTQTAGVIDIQGTITDVQSGPDRAEIAITKMATGEFWNGTSFQNGWARVPATVAGNTWTVPNVDLSAPGQYRVQMWSWDNDGNKASWQANPVRYITAEAGGGPVIDTTPPAIDVTTGLNQNPGVIDIVGTITDAQSGPDRAEIAIKHVATGDYWNGTSFQKGWARVPATVTGNTWTLPNVDLTTSGEYRIQMWSWDEDGNKASWQDNPVRFITVN